MIPNSDSVGTPTALDDNELPPPYRLKWHELLKRIFGIDISQCPWCREATMKFVAVIEDPRVIEKFLSHIDKPPRAPPITPARQVNDWADW